MLPDPFHWRLLPGVAHVVGDGTGAAIAFPDHGGGAVAQDVDVFPVRQAAGPACRRRARGRGHHRSSSGQSQTQVSGTAGVNTRVPSSGRSTLSHPAAARASRCLFTVLAVLMPVWLMISGMLVRFGGRSSMW